MRRGGAGGRRWVDCRFMQWRGPILTRLGGFQVFSHGEFHQAQLRRQGSRSAPWTTDSCTLSWTPGVYASAQSLRADMSPHATRQCRGYPPACTQKLRWSAPLTPAACGRRVLSRARPAARASLASSRCAHGPATNMLTSCTWRCSDFPAMLVGTRWGGPPDQLLQRATRRWQSSTYHHTRSPLLPS